MYSYCSTHDTYPRPDEPCWQCITKHAKAQTATEVLKDLHNFRVMDLPDKLILEIVERQIKAVQCLHCGGNSLQVVCAECETVNSSE